MNQNLIESPTLSVEGSCLSIPLLDGKRIIGLLVLEPCLDDKPKRALIQDLADHAVRAVFRLLLKENTAACGRSIAMVGESRAFLELEQLIRLAAANPKSPVLLSGERGSGKEVAATAIHFLSERRSNPFLPVLTAAFSENLFADELFGHARNSFTGADQERVGKFKAAEGGTIFLDEVADMPGIIQSALLRVLDKGELQQIGNDIPQTNDTRVIAATNRNLAELTTDGRFRADLYDRLKVFEIRVPPLRERLEDIPLLASHFLRKYCRDTDRLMAFGEVCAHCIHAEWIPPEVPVFEPLELAGCATKEFYEALCTLDWPGNVRELEHLIIRLAGTVQDQRLEPTHFPANMNGPLCQKKFESGTFDLSLNRSIKSHLEHVLRMTDHNQSAAARILGIPLSTFRNKMKKLGIRKS